MNEDGGISSATAQCEDFTSLMTIKPTEECYFTGHGSMFRFINSKTSIFNKP